MKQTLNYSLLLTLVFLFVSAHLISQSVFDEYFGENYILNASNYEEWNDQNWEDQDSSEFYYNEKGLLIEELKKIFIDNAWEDHERVVYSYDEQDRLILELTNKMTNGTWLSNDRKIYAHTDSTLIQTNQKWNSIDWENRVRISNNYDGKGNRIQYSIQNWIDGQWLNERLYDMRYNEQNMEIELVSSDWNEITNEWILLFKTNHEYSEEGYLLAELNFFWNDTEWLLTGTNEYTLYPDGNIMTEYVFNYYDLEKDTFLRLEYEYDINNNLESKTLINYQDSVWKNISRQLYQTFEAELRIEWINQSWNNDMWTNNYVHKYYYEPRSTSSVQEFKELLADLSVFPNPSSGIINVDPGFDLDPNARLFVYSTQGQLLLSRTIDSRSGIQTLDLSHLDNSLINLIIQNGQTTISKQVILIK